MFILISTGGADGTSGAKYMETLMKFRSKDQKEAMKEAQAKEKVMEEEAAQKKTMVTKGQTGTPVADAKKPTASGAQRTDEAPKMVEQDPKKAFALELKKVVDQRMAIKEAQKDIKDSEKS